LFKNFELHFRGWQKSKGKPACRQAGVKCEKAKGNEKSEKILIDCGELQSLVEKFHYNCPDIHVGDITKKRTTGFSPNSLLILYPFVIVL
jgi:hypothetical protein